MSRKAKEMIGNKFGVLLVLYECEDSIPKNKKFRVKCTLCGFEANMLGGNIRRHSKRESIGCIDCGEPKKTTQFKVIHGLSGIPENKIWHSMKSRCYNKNHPGYKRYGGRGIEVCERWMDFSNFYEDMGSRPFKDATIDRIDNDKNYEPGNCRWATRMQQSNNRYNNRKINVFGDILSVADASRKYDVKYTTVKERLNRGWAGERALTEAVR